jgi:protein phosphatase
MMDQNPRKPLDEEIDVFGMTDIGVVRQENQDQFLICGLHKRIDIHGTSIPDLERLKPLTSDRLGFLALVADGVGGHAGGREASSAAVEGVLEYVAHSMKCFYTNNPQHEADFLDALHSAVMHCHERVHARAEKDPEYAGMATTLTMYLGVWPRAYVVQVGDSRCYQLRNGTLIQLTRDQTLGQELYDEGLLSTKSLDVSAYSHALSSAVGGPEANPVITTIDLQWDDVLLLCTDGLTRHVSDEEIRDQLHNLDSAEQACRALVGRALERGGVDNVTAVVGRLRPDPRLV